MTTTFVFIAQGIQSLSKNDAETSYELVVLGLILVILVMATFQLHFSRTRKVELAELINGLIQFDQLYRKHKKPLRAMSIYELFSTLTPKAGISWQATISIGVVFGLHWNSPWKITLAGYG